jgi:hypothetical protein
MSRVAGWLTLGLVIAPLAPAQAARDVGYFIMHTSEREALKHCDARLQRTSAEIECANARRAMDYMTLADQQLAAQRGRYGAGSIHSPLFFDANPLGRTVTLRACGPDRGNYRLPPSASECRAAQMSADRAP